MTAAKEAEVSNSSSHSMPARSRWLVGSSSSMTSGSPTRASVMASRLRHPPESEAASAVEIGETGAAGKFTEPALAFVLVDLRRGERLFQDLTNGKAGGKARVLGHIGGARALAHGEFA